MKKLRVSRFPDCVKGEINLPSSKSLSNRALMIKALSGLNFFISNLSKADDTKILEQVLKSHSKAINVENAGTAFRFLVAYFALSNEKVILDGNKRMNERPIKPLVDSLLSMGADISYKGKQGFPPLEIQGKKLRGGKISVDTTISSQFISALLMIAPLLEGGLEIELIDKPVSASYINMTLKIMQHFGIRSKIDGNVITINNQPYIPEYLHVEPDWSSAAFIYGIVALASEIDVFVYDLKADSWQGDSITHSLIKDFGVESKFLEDGVRLFKTQPAITRFEHNFCSCPDLVPMFVILCTLMQIPFQISGIGHLVYKEIDRLMALKDTLRKLNQQIDYNDNEIYSVQYGIFPSEELVLPSFGDHRMAMALGLVAAKFPNIWIIDHDVTAKSYPEFWDDLKLLGINLEISEN